jgi:hypothetical protein
MKNQVNEGGKAFPNGLWLARDLFTGVTGGNVYLYTERPHRNERGGYFDVYQSAPMCVGEMKDFPEITWENSPHHVKVIITEFEEE